MIEETTGLEESEAPQSIKIERDNIYQEASKTYKDRNYLAGLAMSRMLDENISYYANGRVELDYQLLQSICKKSFLIADAMVKAGDED